MVPSFVNLIAFPIKFIRICLNLKLSEAMVDGTYLWNYLLNLMLFYPAWITMRFSISLSMGFNSNSAIINDSFPLKSWVWSSKSWINDDSNFALERAGSNIFFLVKWSMRCKLLSIRPIIQFNGVLISWAIWPRVLVSFSLPI